MRAIIAIIILSCSTIFLFAQNLEVEGTAKITQMPQMNSADQVVVRLPDGTLAQRQVSSLYAEGLGIYFNGETINAFDVSPLNELQELHLSDVNLTISGANTVSLSGLQSPWQKNGNHVYYSNGNVGINTSSPQEKFHVYHDYFSGDASKFEFYSGSIYISTPGSWPGFIAYEQTGKRRDIVFRDYGTHLSASVDSVGTDIFNGLWIRDGGNVGIRTWNPGDYPLLVNELAGTSRGLAIYNDTNNHLWEIYSQLDGRLGLYRNDHALRGTFHETSGVYAPVSDVRLKKDIRPLSLTLNALMQLRPSTYVMKASLTDEREMGFIAQEVKDLFPELVYEILDHKTGESTYTLNYGGMTVIAVKAIQEQQDLIEKQQLEIDQLKQDIASLRNLIKDQ